MARKKTVSTWNEEGQKLCQTCEIFKDPTEFRYKNKCKECYLEYQARYREQHREELRERKRRMRAAQRRSTTRKYRNLDKLRQELESTISNGSCKFCPEDDDRAIRLIKENESYDLDEAMDAFTHEDPKETVCLNCIAKEKHALPLF